ncbi:MAG TPA: hypothetical protein ENG44_02690, partial [Desulfurococcaceae archaeon]|nr:hypothetical protein [Desulfurococcaceae archaeon]
MYHGDLMEYVSLIREIGFGVDLVEGRDDKAVRRAIHDIVHRVAIPYLKETNIDLSNILLRILVYTPNPDKVNDDVIVNELPLRSNKIVVEKHTGGAQFDNTIASIVV